MNLQELLTLKVKINLNICLTDDKNNIDHKQYHTNTHSISVKTVWATAEHKRSKVHPNL